MLTKRELLILTHLRENSRKSLALISRETGIPISTIFEKVNKLEKNTISKYSSLLDFSKIGFALKINFLLKSKNKKNLKEFLLKNKNINSVLRIIGFFDFFVEAVFRDMKDVEKFHDDLNELKLEDKKEIFIIEELKKEKFFTNPEDIKLLDKL
ncbi:MAG: Lrp/AsnC family transcriptional regulator [Candidatus Nanoarchaeia archaeon]|nr:Lrp/AsnC family transcriptional regulator [Candidatus Nanoarchaeia archaeon]